MYLKCACYLMIWSVFNSNLLLIWGCKETPRWKPVSGSWNQKTCRKPTKNGEIP